MNRERDALRLSELSLFCVMRMFGRKLWLILLALVLSGLAAYTGIALTERSQYGSIMTYAVMTDSGSELSAASQQMTGTMAQLLETEKLAEKIRETSGELSGFYGRILAEQIGQSNLIQVRVEADFPETALLAARELTGVCLEFMAYVSEDIELQVIMDPKLDAESDVWVKGLLVCVLAGLCGGAAVCWFLLQMMCRRGTVQSPAAAKRLLEGAILGILGHGELALTQQLDCLCGRMEYESMVHGHSRFLLVSHDHGEGTSCIAGHMVDCLNKRGKQAVLVHVEPGKALSLSEYSDADYVIVDGAPMGHFEDGLILAEQVDASIFVVRQNLTPAWAVNKAVKGLRDSQSTFLGFILNDMRGPCLRQQWADDAPAPIDLFEICGCMLRYVKRKWGRIVALVLICSILGYFGGMALHTPMYEVEATISLRAETEEATERLANVFSEVVGSELMRELVTQSTGRNSIHTEVVSSSLAGTNLFALTALGEFAFDAHGALQAVIDVFPQVAVYMVKEPRIFILEEPTQPLEPCNAFGGKVAAAIGALVGLALGMAPMLWAAVFDPSVYSAQHPVLLYSESMRERGRKVHQNEVKEG